MGNEVESRRLKSTPVMKCYLIQYNRGRYSQRFLFSLFINKLDDEIKITLNLKWTLDNKMRGIIQKCTAI